MKKIVKAVRSAVKLIFSFPFKLIKPFSFNYAINFYFSTLIMLDFIGLRCVRRYFFNRKTQYISSYIENTSRDIIDSYKAKQDVKLNKHADFKIWVFWAQGFENAPDIIQICYNNLCEKYKDKVNAVTMDNYQTYTSLPQHIIDLLNNKTISIIHFSDILRFSLLAKHGGMWIDATCWVTDGLIEAYNMGGLCALKSKPLLKFVANGRWTIWAIGTNVKDCILFALGRDILCRYWESNKVLVDYILVDYIVDYIYDNFSNVKQLIDNVSIDGTKRNDLIQSINNAYSTAEFDSIISGIIVSKLTYKSVLKDYTTMNQPTIYKNLKDIYLH